MSDDDNKAPVLPTTAKELIAVHETLDENTFLWAVRRLPEHEKNLLVPCPVKLCGAVEGEPCRNLNRKDRRTPEFVHFGRKVKRLLAGVR